MEKIEWKQLDEEKMLKKAYVLADFLQAGHVIRLEGDLGAGKTTFTRGLARGLGIERAIKSPSYTIIREYLQGRLPLYHIDLYRLDEGGVSDLALDEYFYGPGVSVVEWGSVSEEDMPAHCLLIKIKATPSASSRDLIAYGKGQDYQNLLDLWDEGLHKAKS